MTVVPRSLPIIWRFAANLILQTMLFLIRQRLCAMPTPYSDNICG